MKLSNFNYLSISKSDQRNTLFFNTNKKNNKNSLNKLVKSSVVFFKKPNTHSSAFLSGSALCKYIFLKKSFNYKRKLILRVKRLKTLFEKLSSAYFDIYKLTVLSLKQCIYRYIKYITYNISDISKHTLQDGGFQK